MYNRKSKILYYHDLHEDGKTPYSDWSTPLSLFKQHIKIIEQSGYNIVTTIDQPKNQVLLCFDDGYRGVWDNKDVLLDNNIYPTVFLISSDIKFPLFPRR